MSSWRVKGLSYLQYLDISADVVRKAVKPEVLSKRATPGPPLNFATWKDGKQGELKTVSVHEVLEPSSKGAQAAERK